MKDEEFEDLLTMSEYCGDDPIEKLKAENAELKLWQESMDEENKSYRELFEYLAENSIGDCKKVIETLREESHWSVMGYVKVGKSINEKGDLILDFDAPGDPKYGKEHRSAKWVPCDNMAVYATRCFEDDWHGYFLFPTHDDNEYLCVWYQN